MLLSLIRRPALGSWSTFSNRLAFHSKNIHPFCTLSPQSSSIFRSNRRSFSSNQQLPPDDPQAQFKPIPPPELNLEMAKGIQTANHLILKYGVGRQRLELLSKENDGMPLVIKW